MAVAMAHELQYPGMSIPSYQKVIRYGKCTESPNSENGLWFVNIKRGDGKAGVKEFAEPSEDHTFLVSEEYARPIVFDEWKRDINKWHEIAHKVFAGNWCVRHEILYRDLPVYEYVMKLGEPVRYAYCKTKNDIDLWYIAFKNGDTHLVRFEHANPEFIERVGFDQKKWQLIALGGNFGSYGHYDELVLGNLSPDMIDRLEPGDLTRNTETRLEVYEKIVDEYHKEQGRPRWDALGESKKVSWIKRLQPEGNELLPS